MGFTDFLFKEDPFKKEPEVKVVDNTPKPDTNIPSAYKAPLDTSKYQAPTYSTLEVDTKNVPHIGGVNQKMYDTIYSEILSEKTIFSKFVGLYDKMNKIISNEQKTVAAVIASMEVDPNEILTSINTNVKSGLVNMTNDFTNDISDYFQTNITNNEKLMANVVSEIENNSLQILELQKKNDELSSKQKELYDIINDNKYTAEQKKGDFDVALNSVSNSIEKWSTIIATYINSNKENV